jgi:hypothetical protein
MRVSSHLVDLRTGGGGKCTRVSLDANHLEDLLCDNCTQGLSELCRDCMALSDLLMSWHRLTPDVREKVAEEARGKS